MRQQREILEHHAHACGGGVRSAPRREIFSRSLPSNSTLPCGRLDQPGQAAHQRRFAGARQAHDDEDLALGGFRGRRRARRRPARPRRYRPCSALPSRSRMKLAAFGPNSFHSIAAGKLDRPGIRCPAAGRACCSVHVRHPIVLLEHRELRTRPISGRVSLFQSERSIAPRLSSRPRGRRSRRRRRRRSSCRRGRPRRSSC